MSEDVDREIERMADEMREAVDAEILAKLSKYKAVPLSPSRNIEDAIGRARNLSASEIWEDALAAVPETDMLADNVGVARMQNEIDRLRAALKMYVDLGISETNWPELDQALSVTEKVLSETGDKS